MNITILKVTPTSDHQVRAHFKAENCPRPFCSSATATRYGTGSAIIVQFPCVDWDDEEQESVVNAVLASTEVQSFFNN